jgi:hypothetical protein
MNGFWSSFETLLGLAVDPKDLTFIQISLRGIIVFLALSQQFGLEKNGRSLGKTIRCRPARYSCGSVLSSH